MREIWIGTGWKMNHLMEDAEEYCQALQDFYQFSLPWVNLFVVPPFTVLQRVCHLLEGTPVWVGAQNMHWEDQGAYTGEISPRMVKDCGARLVELGHSERRAYFGETDFTVNRKVLSALRHGLRPLVCVGETAEEKQAGVAKEVIARQVKISLFGVDPAQVDQILLAYEPIWAIGDKGVPAEPQYASQMHGWIRKQVADLFGPAHAAKLPVLYGGSVNQKNSEAFMEKPEVDGLFIGRSAWSPDSFIEIIRKVEECLAKHALRPE